MCKKVFLMLIPLFVSLAIYSQEPVSDTIGNMVRVPSGTLQINKKTSVVISSDFYIAAYEVTRTAFKDIMGYDGAHAFNSREMTNPANSINWLEAVIFCNKLSMREGHEPAYYMLVDGVKEYDPSKWGELKFDMKSLNYDKRWKGVTWDVSAEGYRLPTECEWMLAAIGTDQMHDITKLDYAGAQKGTKLSDYAWYSWNSGIKFHPVGEKLPNGLGVYDMTGNADEWCYDWYTVKTPIGELTDYCGPETGDWKVTKGGDIFSKNDSWLYPSKRGQGSAFTQVVGNPGFRVARNCPEADTEK
jgi:formylglycine-generating enzyme